MQGAADPEPGCPREEDIDTPPMEAAVPQPLTYRDPYLIDKPLRAAVVIGEGFVNHQEHDAGEEREGQADQDGDLGGQNGVTSWLPASGLQPSKPGGRGGERARDRLSLTCSVTLSKPPAPFGPRFPLLPDTF